MKKSKIEEMAKVLKSINDLEWLISKDKIPVSGDVYFNAYCANDTETADYFMARAHGVARKAYNEIIMVMIENDIETLKQKYGIENDQSSRCDMV